MKKLVSLIIFLSLLFSCSPNQQNPQEILVDYLKQLIDSGEISYVNIIARETETENGYIYYIYQSSTPFIEGEYLFPSEIIEYKSKFICIFKEGQEELSEETVFEITDFYNQQYGITSTIAWYLGISKNENKSFFIKSVDDEIPEDYIELWPIIFKGYNPKATINIIIPYTSYKVIKEDKNNKLPFSPVKFYGPIYIRNMTDSIIPFSLSAETGGCFAVVNGKDTLTMDIDRKINDLDQTKIELEPNENYKFMFQSIYNDLFFNSLDKDNLLKQLFNLERDSIFYFRKETNNVKTEQLVSDKIKVLKSEYRQFTMYLSETGKWYRSREGELIEDD